MIITAYVLKNSLGDCTNNGWSSQYDRVLIWDPEVEKLPNDLLSYKLPLFKVVRRNIQGSEYMHLEPIEKTNGGWMAGGNFAWTTDSRFPNDYPLSIHDRSER